MMMVVTALCFCVWHGIAVEREWRADSEWSKVDRLSSYDKETGTGGSNGATMRFAPEGDHGANAGLKAARDFMEPIKRSYSLLSPQHPPS